MDTASLHQQMAPNLMPDQLSWWPPGIGWIVIGSVLLALALVALTRFSRHTPWWRWFHVRRLRQAYLAELDALPSHPEPDKATGQWLRRLMRDGLGVPPSLPPDRFMSEIRVRMSTPPPDCVSELLQRVYGPDSVVPILHQQHSELQTLCSTCLHLHSPGPG